MNYLEHLKERVRKLEQLAAEIPVTFAGGGGLGSSEDVPEWFGSRVEPEFYDEFDLLPVKRTRRRDFGGGGWAIYYGGWQSSTGGIRQTCAEKLVPWSATFNAGGKISKDSTNIWDEFWIQHLGVRFRQWNKDTPLPDTTPQIVKDHTYFVRQLSGDEFAIGVGLPLPGQDEEEIETITIDSDAQAKMYMATKPQMHFGYSDSLVIRKDLPVELPYGIMKSRVGASWTIPNPFDFVDGRGAKYALMLLDRATLIKAGAEYNVGECENGEINGGT